MGKPDSKCRRKLHSVFSPLRIILWMQIETNDPRFHFVVIAGLRTVL